ncbi:MAG: YceI family protein [Phyllobacterium sp.]
MNANERLPSPLLRAAFAAVLALAPASARADTLAQVAGRYAIQASSRIGFTVAQVGGGGITGSFRKFAGTFVLAKTDIAGSSIDFTLFSDSVSTGQSRIESFLRSDAVFDSAHFPTIEFKSTRVVQTDASTAEVTGMLTARGKSSPAQFHASLSGHGRNSITFHVQGKVMRSRYGMDVGTPIYSNVVQFDMVIEGQRA